MNISLIESLGISKAEVSMGTVLNDATGIFSRHAFPLALDSAGIIG